MNVITMTNRVLILTLIAACDGSLHDRENENKAASVLPDLRSGSECSPQTQTPISICDWLASTDAVVWARIRSVDFETTTSSCDAPEDVPLRLELEVTRTLHGEVEPDLTVLIGAEQYQYFDPIPLRDAVGSLRWVGRTDVTPLQPGTFVGLALHRAVNHWTLMGEAMFGLSTDARKIEFQRSERNCGESLPNLMSLTVDALAHLASGCATSGSATSRRARIRDLWGPRSSDTGKSVRSRCFSNTKN